jgi:hypothetical protein
VPGAASEAITSLAAARGVCRRRAPPPPPPFARVGKAYRIYLPPVRKARTPSNVDQDLPHQAKPVLDLPLGSHIRMCRGQTIFVRGSY